MTRIVTVSLLVVLVAAASYLYLGRGWQPPAPHARASSVRSAAKPGTIMPLQALADSRQRFRLALDGRFVQAVSLIAEFPDFSRTVVPQTKFGDEAWTISVGGKVIGRLPAYPDFDDMLALLKGEVAQVNPGLKPTSDTAAVQPVDDAAFDDAALIASLQSLDKAYHPGHVSVTDLRWSASQVARLAYFEDDTTQAGDGLYAKSLTLLALAEAEGGAAMPKSEGLLASAMGYSAAAARRALNLPAADPWRLYFTRSDDELQQAAMLDPQSSELSYFWLRRLADMDRADDWISWIKAHYSGRMLPIYALQTVSTLQGHSPVLVSAYGVPAAVLANLGQSGSALGVADSVFFDPKGAMARFQDGLGHLQTPDGPYLGRSDLAGYYSGDFYAAVQRYGSYLLDQWGRASDAQRYLQLLDQAPDEAGHELRTWYADKIASEEGGRGLADVVDDMAGSRIIGPGIYADMLTTFGDRLDPGTPEIRGAAQRIGSLFDTRPDLRDAYADLLGAALDVPDREDIYRSLAAQESDDDSYVRVYLYAHDGDSTALLRVARDRHLAAWLRAQALTYLQKQDYPADVIGLAYDDIIAEYPAEGSGYEAYLTFLQDKKDFAGAERVAKSWLLSQPSDKNIFDFWKATDSEAEAELDMGDSRQAWFTLVPALFQDRTAPAPGTPASDLKTTGYGRSLDLGYSIAMANHDSAMAQALAETEANLYPDDIASQTEMLRYWWATGDDDQAAAELAHWPHPVAAWQWDHTIGTAFAKTLGADTDKAAPAFAALARQRIPLPMLQALVRAVADSGHPQTAFTLLTQLVSKGGGAPTLIEAYIPLKQYETPAAAEQWLDTQLPAGHRDELSMYMYAMHQDELLWDIVDPGKTARPDQVWLLRAAAVAEGLKLSSSQQAALADYLSLPSKLWYDELARYVTGKSDGSSLLQKPLDTHALSEASYYLALREFSLGHYREGAEWLNVDMDTAELRNGEWRMGQELLSNSVASGQSMQLLASEGKLFVFPF